MIPSTGGVAARLILLIFIQEVDFRKDAGKSLTGSHEEAEEEPLKESS